MSTLPPPFTKEFPADSLEKRVYTLIDSFAEYLPIPNDRNRLSYSLFKYMTGEGDPALVSIKAAKVTIKGIETEELARRIDKGLQELR